ncbi:hypothetical protein BGX26_008633 [Mortierella sp. AD094]|nr:hypothetical protein BGX26_008633 [Mortierella sp. AD094]
MKSSATTLIAYLATSLPLLSSIANAFVYPATPVGATVWKPNSNVTITWTEDNIAPTLSSRPVFDIFLMTDADDRQIKLETIAADVKGGAVNSVNYKVPYVSPPGQIYFLMFQTRDLNAAAWATRFTITDANGDPGNLKPVTPVGGKINPGGVGTIISAIEAKAQAKQTKKNENKSKANADLGAGEELNEHEKHSKSASEEASSENSGSSSSPASSESSQSSSSESSSSPSSGKSSSSSSSSDTNTEDHASHGSPVGAGLKAPISSGGNSDPSLVDVGVRVNKDKNGVARSAGSTTTVSASSTAMVAFVGFAVLMGF